MKNSKIQTVLIAAWLLAITWGIIKVTSYAAQPGLTANSPLYLPSDVLTKQTKNLPTLLVFLHPQCPCSRATINELARLAARNQNLVEIQVLFYQPANLPHEWADTDLRYQTAQISGVHISTVNDAQLELFGDVTSGQTMLYSADKQLVFSGGITDARGHEGDNDGRLTIENYLRNGKTVVSQTPVFGCALTSSEKKF